MQLSKASGILGFSLLECLLVVVLMGVLAGVGVQGAFGLMDRARVWRARSELAVITQALERYRSAMGDFPRTRRGVDLLAALEGRLTPDLRPAQEKAFLKTEQFERRVEVASGLVQLMDPWGSPYEYDGTSAGADAATSYMLFSWGPEREGTAEAIDGARRYDLFVEQR